MRAPARIQRLVFLEKNGTVADELKDDVAAKYSFPRNLCDTQEGKASVVVDAGGKSVRYLLIEESAAKKKEDENYYARKLVNAIRASAIGTVFVISDWRYPHEFKYLKEELGEDAKHLTIRITRDRFVQFVHDSSEIQLDNWNFDCRIMNGELGLFEATLLQEVRKFLFQK